MNTPTQPNDQDTRPKVDQRRRMLAKGGLAAPIVLGTLMSRPVLGAAPHNCTISGQLSGNVSTHLQGICTELGDSPEIWLSRWPWNMDDNFYNTDRNTLAGARNFHATPNTASVKFLRAYRARDVDGIKPNDSRAPTVLEVLLGYVPIYDTSFGYTPTPDSKFNLVVRNRYTDSAFELGKEAIGAYLNAVAKAPDFPLSTIQVVAMFNAVIVTGGSYPVSPTVSWNASQVLAYFQSLHT